MQKHWLMSARKHAELGFSWFSVCIVIYYPEWKIFPNYLQAATALIAHYCLYLNEVANDLPHIFVFLI